MIGSDIFCDVWFWHLCAFYLYKKSERKVFLWWFVFCILMASKEKIMFSSITEAFYNMIQIINHHFNWLFRRYLVSYKDLSLLLKKKQNKGRRFINIKYYTPVVTISSHFYYNINFFFSFLIIISSTLWFNLMNTNQCVCLSIYLIRKCLSVVWLRSISQFLTHWRLVWFFCRVKLKPKFSLNYKYQCKDLSSWNILRITEPIRNSVALYFCHNSTWITGDAYDVIVRLLCIGAVCRRSKINERI